MSHSYFIEYEDVHIGNIKGVVGMPQRIVTDVDLAKSVNFLAYRLLGKYVTTPITIQGVKQVSKL